ncbi:hypothetical protein KUCAC02_013690 [Chaenocephalus aceratus]|uniref:Uncharacterized protein n=2 Tax=Channichthyidae TaxID=30806 RepID=A0ACB9WBL4_CHAAC|nr:hypothetical protein KUCAC02_013690 [Chaenocephalus aceratus]
MCIGSTGSLDTITLPATALPRPHAPHPHRKTAAHGPPGSRHPHSSLSALKNGVLQLPLCEKTLSVNIQRGGGSAPVSCCQVI